MTVNQDAFAGVAVACVSEGYFQRPARRNIAQTHLFSLGSYSDVAKAPKEAAALSSRNFEGPVQPLLNPKNQRMLSARGHLVSVKKLQHCNMPLAAACGVFNCQTAPSQLQRELTGATRFAFLVISLPDTEPVCSVLSVSNFAADTMYAVLN